MRQRHTRWAGMCAVGAILALTAGCGIADDLLSVKNPSQITIDEINNILLFQARVNGAEDRFVTRYGEDIIQYASYLGDEQLTGNNWEDYARVNQRIVSYLEGQTNRIYEGMQKGLRQAHNLAEQIKVWQAADPAEWVPIGFESADEFNPGLAKSLVFAGYSALVLAENMCQVVISPDPDSLSTVVVEQMEIFDLAIPYLEEAASVAALAGEDDMVNLARVGLARANLGRANWAQAASWANLVPSGFEWWINHIDVSGGRNPLQGYSNGGNFKAGIHPNFTGIHPSFDNTGFDFEDNDVIAPQTDPRIQHWTRDRTGHNGLTRMYKIFQGLRYADYTGETIAPSSAACPLCTGTDEDDMELLAEYDTDILLADYTEAQHHYYEALAMQGGNEAAVLTFVNARRAVGNQAAVALTGQALITELRNQRARDLFMGGFRVPDLRRWTRFDPGNGPFASGSYFPTGIHPNDIWGAYGEWTCYPIPISEYIGNPGLAKPANPNTPPGI